MEVRWSIDAKADYDSNIDYLLHDWNVEVAMNFVKVVDNLIIQLKSQPFSFKETNRKGIHGGPIIPQVNIYYRVLKEDNAVELLNFWNNFQAPKKNQHH